MERSIPPYERFGGFVPQSDAGLKRHVFGSTDTITWLAYVYYGDPRLWRVIADRNGIADPRKIEAGALLLIPQKPVERGRYESL